MRILFSSRIYLVLLVCIFVCKLGFGQYNSELEIRKQLDSLRIVFSQEQAKVDQQNKILTDSILILYLSKLQQETSSEFTTSGYFEAYQNLLRKDLGLKFNIDGVQNFNISQKDIEENILYQRRFQTGLEWNILKGGLLDSRNTMKTLPSQELYENQVSYYQQLKRNSSIKMNHCIFWFNDRKMQLLEQREQLLNKQYETLEKLYFAKKITREHLLRNQTRLAEIHGMKGIYASYNDYMPTFMDSSLIGAEAPLFDLNYEKLLIDIQENTSVDSIGEILRNQAMEQHKWYNEVNLKTFFRYNYYDLLTTNPNARTFYNIGISAGIPLPFSQKQAKELELQKVGRQMNVLQLAVQNKKIEILNEAYEFRYQLKQYIVFHQKRILAWESIRQERVKAKLLDADFNPVHGLELLDDLLQIDIELLDLKQNLYIKLLKIQEKMPEITMQELLIPLQLPNYFNFEDEIYRSCYVWSKTFESHPVEFLSEYILYNQFDEIQLAIAKEDKNLENKLMLIEQLKNKGTKIQLMLGQNELLGDPNYTSIVKGLIQPYLLKNISGIHLDIEPHTRADWKLKQSELMAEYKKLIQETKLICSTYNLKLSIDLPLNLDTTYVKDLIGQVDAVRFMCYENIKQEYLIRKLTPYLQYRDKLSISIRTEDFLSRQEMEDFSKEFLSKVKINGVNFHDLNRLIALDRKSLIQDEKH